MEYPTFVSLACGIVNELFLSLPVPVASQTRADAAKPWTHVLEDKGLPIVFDDAEGRFVPTHQPTAGDNGESEQATPAEVVEIDRGITLGAHE